LVRVDRGGLLRRVFGRHINGIVVGFDFQADAFHASFRELFEEVGEVVGGFFLIALQSGDVDDLVGGDAAGDGELGEAVFLFCSESFFRSFTRSHSTVVEQPARRDALR
jgi:hypothetical protein